MEMYYSVANLALKMSAFAIILRAELDTCKGSFISDTFDNFDHLNHHWPKIPANLNLTIGKFARQGKNSNLLEF